MTRGPGERGCALRVSFLHSSPARLYNAGDPAKSGAAGLSVVLSTRSALACGLGKVPEVAEHTQAPQPDPDVCPRTFCEGQSPVWCKNPGHRGRGTRQGRRDERMGTDLPALSCRCLPAVPMSPSTATSKRNSALLSLASHLQRRGANPQRQGARGSWREVPLDLGRVMQGILLEKLIFKAPTQKS